MPRHRRPLTERASVIYLPAFKPLSKRAAAGNGDGAYNNINAPTAPHYRLLTEILRGEWH